MNITNLTKSQNHAIEILKGVNQWGDIYALSGSSNARVRALIMAELNNVDKYPQAKSGVTAIKSKLYELLNIKGDCEANRESNFRLAIGIKR